jgi:hypothetical protein
MMSDVYGSSAINIAATGVDDTNQACFFDRRDGWGCRFTTHSEEGELDIIEFLRPLEVGGLQRRPLSLRGWALQERILPHRTIHFTKTQIFWECNEIRCCETFPAGYPSEIINILPLNKRPITMEYWDDSVHRYPMCRLTLDRDK